jgi:riboflavin kinase/FMN adenylyltransferase
MRLDEVDSGPAGGRVVAIGVFDGVHLGHQSIIAEAVAAASESEARPTVVTFYPHPEAVLRPGSGPRSLTLPGRKAELLLALGIQEVVTVEFDQRFADLQPEEFCSIVLSERLGARAVLVGKNFHFGRHGAGSSGDLAAYGRKHGFSVGAVPLVREGGGPISSTRIRGLLDLGEVAAAAALLGRPHRLEGTVVRGAGRGRSLRAPTANVEVCEESTLPAQGVYATTAVVDNGAHKQSVTSVGSNPTFETGDEIRVETLLLDFEGDLYGRSIAVDFVERLRGHEAFDSPEALAGQIRKDVERARNTFVRLSSGLGA